MLMAINHHHPVWLQGEYMYWSVFYAYYDPWIIVQFTFMNKLRGPMVVAQVTQHKI